MRKTEPISIASAPHYLWGNGCDGWHLMRTPAVSILEERMPPGTAERRHKHQESRQFFYVLSGELTIELEGTDVKLGPQTGLEVGPGKAHQAFNRGSADVRFLVTSQPPSQGDRIDA